MSDPIFLTLEQVQIAHAMGIKRFGGLSGVRDEGMLEAATIQPQNVYFYGHGDLFDVAAAYAYHIAESQAFFDGNKRAAVNCALTFLLLNGVRVRSESTELYEAMMAIAQKRMDRVGLAQVLRGLAVNA